MCTLSLTSTLSSDFLSEKYKASRRKNAREQLIPSHCLVYKIPYTHSTFSSCVGDALNPPLCKGFPRPIAGLMTHENDSKNSEKKIYYNTVMVYYSKKTQ